MDHLRVMSVINDLNFDWKFFSLNNFIDHIAQYRNRPIYLIPIPDLENSFVFSLGTTDYIGFNSQQLLIVRQHDLLHELAHLLLDHVDAVKFVSDFEEVQAFIHIGFRRPVQTKEYSEEENEAEYFVYLIQKQLQEIRLLGALTDDERTGDPQMPPFTKGLLK
jgi:hypothetical protein